MNTRYLILLLAGILLSITGYSQNKPVTTGLPNDPMSGVITYPTNLNVAPNTTPTYYNYKRVYTPLAAMSAVPSFDNTVNMPVLVHTTYGDGLGNGLMEISRTNAGDIIVPFYNRVSRTKVAFLPYIGSHHLKFQPTAYSVHNLQYRNSYPLESTVTTSTAYSKTVTETDPNTGLTVTRSFAPGKAFVGQERGTTTTTAIHAGSEIFILESGGSTICKNGYYAAGSLTEKIEKTPHTEVVTYYDKSNRAICKKTYLQNKTVTQYTYYVYNELGKLIHVVTPRAAALLLSNNCLNSTRVNQLCYNYVYDSYGNPIEKGTPGKTGREYMVYDRLHRPVLVQNPLLSSQNKWAFTLYDNRGRATLSGIYSAGTDDRAALQDYIDNQAAYVTSNMYGSLLYYIVNYVSAGYPGSITNCEINTINYYDDYATGPASQTSYDNSYSSEFLTGSTYETPTPYYFAIGKPVATKQRIINDNSFANNFVNTWITSVFYYDEKGRVIQTQTLNPWNVPPGQPNAGHWDVSAQQYDFTGNAVYTVSKHYLPRANKTATEVRTRNVYNANTGRLEEVRMQLDSEPWQTLQQYTYDSWGRISHKWIGGTEEQNYTYNIQGKTIGVNANYINTPATSFLPTMTYAETVSFEQGFSVPRYDGSLSGFKWRTSGGNVSAYGYGYDDMGRMTKADFTEWSDSLTYGKKWNKLSRDFSVGDITYDRNGNMKKMKQYGYNQNYQPALIDNLTYTYAANSNQLASVTDAGNDSPIDDFDNSVSSTASYSYDADGNLSQDDLKNIYLEYNHQDLPVEVTHGSGATVKNIYDASGALLQKHINENSVDTRYLYWGPFVYRNDSLLYIQHPEGRCRWVNDTGVFRYDYFIKDHLGNVRTVVTTDAQSLSTYYLATHEVASANIEGLIFENIDDVRSPNPVYDTENQDAAQLNGSDPDRRIGTSLLLQVMAGDKVNLQAWSYHEGKDPENDNFANAEDMFEALVNTLSGGKNGFDGATEIDDEQSAIIMDNIFGNPQTLDLYEGLKLDNTDPDHPRAYLNYLFFDEEFNLINEDSRVIQVSGTANSWEQIGTPDIPVSQTGHLLIYISNEQGMDVFFDNIAVTYTKGRLLEENHYYPHGLLVKGTTATGVTENKQKYQGKLLQDELGMQLYDFHARQYDPQIGRFWGIDPLDQFPSGYTGMGNNPANMVDPSGMAVNMYDGNGFANKYNPNHPGFQWKRQQLLESAMQKMLEAEAASSDVSPLRIMMLEMEASMRQREIVTEQNNLSWELTIDQMIERSYEELESTGSPNMVMKDGKPTLKEVAEKQVEAGNNLKEAKNNVEEVDNMGNNEKNNIDIDYAIIANNKEGAMGKGHNALLVGNSEHGFQFISKEGRNEDGGGSSNNPFSGGPALKPLDLPYDNFQDFLNDSKRAEYDRFIIVPISHETGVQMINTMRAEANSNYNLLFNNCGDAVNNTLIRSGYNLQNYSTPNHMFNNIYNVMQYYNSMYYSR